MLGGCRVSGTPDKGGTDRWWYLPASHHSVQRARGSEGLKAPIAARVGWWGQCCH